VGVKKIDIILSLITGEGVAWLFIWFLKNTKIGAGLLIWILPIFFPFLALFCLWIAYLIGKKFIFIFQLAKFILIGSFFALFDLIILNFLMIYFGITKGIDYLIFVSISFIIATVTKYAADKFWAFEKSEKGQLGTEFGSFFIITLISLGIQIGIANLIVNQIGPQFSFSPIAWASVGKLGGIAVASAWNFIGYKFIVFKK